MELLKYEARHNYIKDTHHRESVVISSNHWSELMPKVALSRLAGRRSRAIVAYLVGFTPLRLCATSDVA